MDYTNNSQDSYYYHQNMPLPLHSQEVYFLGASTSTRVHDHSYSQQLYQQQQDAQYSHQRHPRPPQMHQQHLQLPRAQNYPHQIPSSMHQHEHLRHTHSQPSPPCVTPGPPFSHSAGFISLLRTSRSPPSETSTAYHSDPLSSLRDDLYAPSTAPRLPPILQVAKQQVTTTATQVASAIRRRDEARFRCPVPGCGSTFTRRFNLKGHLRSHTSERPYACEWPGCGKAFARQHDCKRHYQLHSAEAGTHMCLGCGKSFSRTDALNRHLRSESGMECRAHHQGAGDSFSSGDYLSVSSRGEDSESPSDTTDGTTSRSPSRSRPPSVWT